MKGLSKRLSIYGARLRTLFPVRDHERAIGSDHAFSRCGRPCRSASSDWMCRRASNTSGGSLIQPVMACGIAWFFLTLAVESSIIPLDPLFEHRLYLPMFGFVMIVAAGLELLPRPAWQQGAAAAVLLQLGIRDTARAKASLKPMGYLVGEAVISGEADLGLSVMSEFVGNPALQTVPFPDALQKPQLYTAGVFAGSAIPALCAWCLPTRCKGRRSRT